MLNIFPTTRFNKSSGWGRCIQNSALVGCDRISPPPVQHALLPVGQSHLRSSVQLLAIQIFLFNTSQPSHSKPELSHDPRARGFACGRICPIQIFDVKIPISAPRYSHHSASPFPLSSTKTSTNPPHQIRYCAWQLGSAANSYRIPTTPALHTQLGDFRLPPDKWTNGAWSSSASRNDRLFRIKILLDAAIIFLIRMVPGSCADL